MIGDFLTRGLVMVFGYAYPAYECFKTVEKNKPEIEQLQFWCQYWILIAMLTIFERIGDNFVSWVPMYSEAKLAFVIFLWYPKTKGTTYVYDSFFKPYMAKHETEIDRNLLELRNRAGKMAFISFQKVASYGQTRIFEVLQYIAAQSAPTPQPAQPRRPAPGAHQPPAGIAAAGQPSTGSETTQPHNEHSPSSNSSASSSQPEKEVRPEISSTLGLHPSTSGPAASMQALIAATALVKKVVSMSASPESSSQSASNDVEEMQIEPVPGTAEETVPDDPAPPQETVIEEVVRVTRGRLRKTQSTVTK